ncbi:MAG: hypothetical protein Fur0043_09540 [Anaerolineales bacterium]
MKNDSNRLLPLFLEIFLFPLIASLLMGPVMPEPPAPERTISVYFLPGDAGEADYMAGYAPKNMELAAYLNGRLLATTTSRTSVCDESARTACQDAPYPPEHPKAAFCNALLQAVTTRPAGCYIIPLPVLKPRANEMSVAPTTLDASTLALLYDVRGIDNLHAFPADLFLEPPFLAAVFRQAGELELRGSALPSTQLEIHAENCSASPSVIVKRRESPDDVNLLDDEGSFTAHLPFDIDAPLPKQYCIQVTPVGAAAAATETFIVAAPAEGLSRAQPKGLTRAAELWKRSIELHFTPTSVHLVFSVEMPYQTLVYQNLSRGGLSELQFIEYVFGEVSLNTYLDPRKLSWWQEKSPDSDRVRVLVESQPLEYLIPQDTATTFQLNTAPLSRTEAPPYSDADTLTITLDNVRVLEADPPAAAGDVSSQTWRGIPPDTRQLRLKISRAIGPPANPIGRMSLLNTITRVVSQLDIVPSATLRDTLEGQIVDVLPVRAPAEVQARVYDYYSAIYRNDPFVDEAALKQTFQSLLQDLPKRIPDWLASLLFGCIWFIPGILLLWTLRADDSSAEPSRAALARLAAGVLVLTALGLDWLNGLSHFGLRRETFLEWQVAGYFVFIILFLPLPKWEGWLVKHPRQTLFGSLLAAPFVVVMAWSMLVYLPDGWGSVLLTTLPLLSFCCLLWLGWNVGRVEHKAPSLSITLATLAVVLLLSLPIQSLPLGAQLAGMIGVSALGATLTRPLVSLALLAGVILMLRRELNASLGASLHPLARGLGRVLLVGFAVGLTPAWGFIPLSIVGGLAFFEWLLPRNPIVSAQVAASFIEEHHEEGVKNLLNLNRQTRLWRATRANAQKQARENKLDEKQFEERRQEYETKKEDFEKPDYLKDREVTLHDLAFNFGAGKEHWDNLQNALAWGVILALPLVVLQGWPLAVEAIENAGTFPFLSTGVRLATLTAQYLAAAAFLGYFFPYLRGRNGLEKGGWLAAATIFSFLPYHIINAGSLTEWLVVAIWAASLLAFNLIVSLLAFDIRTLLYFKQGLSALPDLYDFGELAAYLTGSGAPLVTTIFTAITNQLDQWVPALLHVVFPSFTLSEAQFQLLQLLIDLVQRIASG